MKKKNSQKEFRTGKVIKGKKIFKWKGCDNSFNNWIDIKEIL